MLFRHLLQRKTTTNDSRTKKAAPPERMHARLEDRTLFDAAALIEGIDASFEPIEPATDAFATEQCRACDLELATTWQETPVASDTRIEVAFIDPSVEGYEAIARDLQSQGIELTVLEQGADGLEQIAKTLSGRTDVDAIHIVSHGDQAELQLGSTRLTADSMRGEHAAELAMIRESLSGSADLLIYGCNFGEGAAGAAAAGMLANLTGADVAASNDLTGAAKLGGDWELELEIGSIETHVAVSASAQAAWSFVLLPPTIDLDLDDSSGATGSDYKATFTEGGAPQPIADVDAEINDPDSPGVTTATITLTNAQPGDLLAADTADPAWPAGISVDPSSTATNIVLVGADTWDNYEYALNLITFENTQVDPSEIDRVIQITVEDGLGETSAPAMATICVERLSDIDGDGIDDIDDIDDDNDGIVDANEPINATVVDSGVDGAFSAANLSFGITSAAPTVQGTQHDLDSITITGVNAVIDGTYTDYIVPDAFEANYAITSAGSAVEVFNGSDTSVDYVTDPAYDDNILPAFRSANLQHFQRLDSTISATDYYTLTYNTPILSTAGSFIAVTERGGNNPVHLEAFDTGGASLGTITLTPGTDYVDTGHIANNFQNIWLALFPLDDLAPVGAEIASIDVTMIGATGDGPDGKVFIYGDETAVYGAVDTDKDGVSDHLDLDADNDGISDLYESGDAAGIALDTNGDGYLDLTEAVDSDRDGLMDVFEDGNLTANVGTTPVDTDMDGIDDLLDLDSDNDKIPDTVEARLTAGYVANADPAGDNDSSNNDNDGDGVIDIFDANDSTTMAFGGTHANFNDPVDSDSDGMADYVDTDSDNDTMSDMDESGLAGIMTGADLDMDGIDDGIGASYCDPDGDINDPSNDLGNETGDTTEVGFREVVSLSAVSLTKSAGSIIPATSGIAGNFEITYTLNVTNTGTETLTGLSIVDPWATQFGNNFVRVLPGSVVVTNGDATVAPAANASYAGGAAENMLDGSGTLEAGQTFTVTVVVEVDADADPAALNNGMLENTAVVSGLDPTSTTISDTSDDPSNSANVDANLDGEPDDPTLYGVSDLQATKAVEAFVAAASGTPGNYDVTYLFTVTNTGTEDLTMLSIVDDWAGQFGGAYIQVLPGSVSVMNGDATTAPGANATYSGGAAANMLDGTGLLESGQSFMVRVTVEVDPDNGTALVNANGALENTALVSGQDQGGGTVSDLTDDPNNNTNSDADLDNDPDDPTAFTAVVTSIGVTKAAGTPVSASNGVDGNYDVTYTFVVENTGTETLTGLSLVDDWVGQLGGAFVGIVTNVEVTNVDATTAPTANNAYAGGASENMLAGSGVLAAGESFIVTITVELDPDADSAALNANGQLENFAMAAGMDATNTTVSDVSDDPNNTTNSDANSDGEPDDVTAIGFARLAVTKAVVGPPTAATSGAAGNFDVTFNFVVTNTGSETLSHLSLMDDLATQYGGAFVGVLPGSVVVTNVDATGAPTANAGFNGTLGSDLLAGGAADALASGQSFIVSLTVEIDPDAPTANLVNGQLANSATAFGRSPAGTTISDVSDNPGDTTNTDPNGDNNPDDPTLVGGIDLSISKDDGGATASPGGSVVYTITYGNNGLSDATGVVVTETLPAGTSYDPTNSTSGWVETSPGVFAFTAGTVVAGEVRTIQFAVTVDATLPAGFAVVSNDVTIADDGANGVDSNTANNAGSDTTPVLAAPDYVITKDNGQTSVAVGDTITYTLTITNVGTQDGTGVVVTDTLPPYLTNVTASNGGVVNTVAGTITWNVGSVAVGDVMSLTVTAEVTGPISAGIETLTNSGNVTDDGTNGVDPNPGDNVAADTDTLNAAPDYEITKDDGLASAEPGDSVTYTITVTNVGDQDGTGVVVTDDFPPTLLTNVTASGGGVIDTVNGTITWNVGNLAVGDAAVYTVTGDIATAIPGGVNRITNLASVMDDGANGQDPNTGNNSDQDINDIIAGPDYVITKDDGLTTANAGDTVSYTITVTNTGNRNGSNVVVTDTYPLDLLTTVVADGNGVVDANSGTITWNIASLDVGDTAVYTVTGQITTAVPAGIDTITNSVSVTDDGANGNDANLDNNEASDTDTLVAAPDLSITKTDNGATVALGSSVVYTLSYTNTGTQDASGVQITETLPAGTAYDAANSTDGWSDIGNNQFVFNAGTVVVGEVREIHFAVTVTDANAAGLEITNNASIADDGTNGVDLNTGNNTGSDTTLVAGGEIEGFVYNDSNGNGVFDDIEMPLSGVQIELSGTDTFGNRVFQTAYTDANGRYYFEDLPQGDYEIRQIQPANFTDGLDSSGTPGADVGDDVIHIALSGGQAAVANNFGEAGLAPGAISKRYFLNTTNSGIYEDVILPGDQVQNPVAPAGFTQTASGLSYRIINEGTGDHPTAFDTVTVDYEGWLPDPDNGDEGPVFDSSYDRGQPSTFSLSSVIAGWTEGLQLVREGGTIELEIPPSLGYGETGTASGSIPPNATLRFIVELHSIA
jgi:uncharacterized repeat protein (TIGR01451 family)